MKPQACYAKVSELCCATLSMAAQTDRPLLKREARACAYVTEWLSELAALRAVDRLGKLRAARLRRYHELWKLFTSAGVLLGDPEFTDDA
eukprot:5344696-Alexandrium_andersonii.AAC.1